MQTISPLVGVDPRGWDALDRCGGLIIESATNSLVISDPHQPDCPIVYANPAFLHATGYRADEIIGRNCRFLQGPDTDHTTIATMRAAVADERACTVILLNYRKDGSEFWQELTISPVRDDDAALLYFIGIQADITDLKRAHAAVERAQEDQGLLLHVAVNLSARLLHDPAVVDTIVDALRTAGVEPRWLEIEITESAAMVDPAGALAILTRLHALGIRLAIDDFGTGYSSLSYLKRLPVDEIKIDKSFVREMPRNGDDAAIARSIIDLGHNLGLGVVAEGVEDDATWGQLATLGCDVAQGYHISRPVPAAELARWVQTTKEQGGSAAHVMT